MGTKEMGRGLKGVRWVGAGIKGGGGGICWGAGWGVFPRLSRA